MTENFVSRDRALVRARREESQARWGVGGLMVALFAAGLVAATIFMSGCVPVEAIDQAREEHAINAGHAIDARGELPLEARMVAADNMRAWAAQHKALTGDELVSPELPSDLAPEGPQCGGCYCVGGRSPGHVHLPSGSRGDMRLVREGETIMLDGR